MAEIESRQSELFAVGSLGARACAAFVEHFGRAPTIVARAPGRVELLGNHTDYNGGVVMSAAIDRWTVVAGAPSGGPEVRIYSKHFQEILDTNKPASEVMGWRRYVLGVLAACRASDTIGFHAVIDGDIPLGAGLSSSASLETAVALFLRAFEGQNTALDDNERMALARTLQCVENEAVGVACGLLDQFSVLLGKSAHALWLDCATTDFGRVSLGDNPPAIVVCDTKSSRRLADGQYNVRRAECERVVSYFRTQAGGGGIRWLRDVTLEQLERHWAMLDPVGKRRARHVLSENERVRAGIQALERGDIAELGRLLSASHESSRLDFENSSSALDTMIDVASGAPGFLGGKLSGAGWAGCTVNLVQGACAAEFAESVQRDYAARTGTTPEVHICAASEGATWELRGSALGK